MGQKGGAHERPLPETTLESLCPCEATVDPSAPDSVVGSFPLFPQLRLWPKERPPPAGQEPPLGLSPCFSLQQPLGMQSDSTSEAESCLSKETLLPPSLRGWGCARVPGQPGLACRTHPTQRSQGAASRFLPRPSRAKPGQVASCSAGYPSGHLQRCGCLASRGGVLVLPALLFSGGIEVQASATPCGPSFSHGPSLPPRVFCGFHGLSAFPSPGLFLTHLPISGCA